MTFEAVMVSFIIPNTILSDIRGVQIVLKQKLLSNDEIIKIESEEGNNGERFFTASDYFFASTLIAKEFTNLPESSVILSYRNVYPGNNLFTKKSDEYFKSLENRNKKHYSTKEKWNIKFKLMKLILINYNSKIGCYYFFYDCIVNIDVIGSGCNT